jgi:heme/copper-type cytochrome/quinol oxidase subunit 2
MGMWTWSLMGMVIIVGGIGLYATLKVMRFEKRRESANDSPIPEGVKEHPALFNPIIWAYIFAFIFIMSTIAYYAASTP